VNDGLLTMNVSGTGLSGGTTFTANQAAPATFTVTSNATSANTASTIVARDASGNFSAGTITAVLNGNASTATSATSAGSATTATTATNLGGGALGSIPYQSAAGTTSFVAAGTSGYILQANGAAAPSWVAASTAAGVNNGTLTMNVSGTGLSGSQTFTANQAGSATFTVTSNATSANTASTIVARDASGNFSAGTITASLNGNASTATTAANGGVTSLAAGSGIGISSSTGAVTVSNNGVTSNVAGTGISISGATGASTITNTGVTSNVAGTGISISGATGASTITNTGVTSLTAGSGISLSGSTGGVTITSTASGGALVLLSTVDLSTVGSTTSSVDITTANPELYYELILEILAPRTNSVNSSNIAAQFIGASSGALTGANYLRVYITLNSTYTRNTDSAQTSFAIPGLTVQNSSGVTSGFASLRVTNTNLTSSRSASALFDQTDGGTPITGAFSYGSISERISGFRVNLTTVSRYFGSGFLKLYGLT
jgi:hypothetical protein